MSSDFRKATLSGKRTMLAEYKRLPNPDKSGWLAKHNATGAMMTYYKRLFKHEGNGSHTGVLDLKKPRNDTDGAKTRVHSRLSVAVSGALSAYPGAGRPVSIEDAIAALEIKRDSLSEVIEDLKRMQRG